MKFICNRATLTGLGSRYCTQCEHAEPHECEHPHSTDNCIATHRIVKCVPVKGETNVKEGAQK